MRVEKADQEKARTPMLGILLGYVFCCVLAALWLVTWFSYEQRHIPELRDFFGGLSTFTLFALLFCVLPFLFFRWIISELGTYRRWQYMIMGALVGTIVALVILEPNPFTRRGAWVVLTAMTLPGLFIGWVSYRTEEFFRGCATRRMQNI